MKYTNWRLGFHGVRAPHSPRLSRCSAHVLCDWSSLGPVGVADLMQPGVMRSSTAGVPAPDRVLLLHGMIQIRDMLDTSRDGVGETSRDRMAPGLLCICSLTNPATLPGYYQHTYHCTVICKFLLQCICFHQNSCTQWSKMVPERPLVTRQVLRLTCTLILMRICNVQIHNT